MAGDKVDLRTVAGDRFAISEKLKSTALTPAAAEAAIAEIHQWPFRYGFIKSVVKRLPQKYQQVFLQAVDKLEKAEKGHKVVTWIDPNSATSVKGHLLHEIKKAKGVVTPQHAATVVQDLSIKGVDESVMRRACVVLEASKNPQIAAAGEAFIKALDIREKLEIHHRR